MINPNIVQKQMTEAKQNLTTLDLTDPQVAGVDIEITELGPFCIACVHPTLAEENLRKCPINHLNLQTMSGWLKDCGVTTIVMPKKSAYWEDVFRLLHEFGFNLCLVDARRFSNFSRLWKDGKDSIFEMINPDAAGIDIGKTHHWVCVPEGRADNSVRRFETFTCDLYDIASWLKQCGVTTIAMESTGVYWIPIFQILEKEGFEVFLVNARHLKNVPGRPKTDNLDCRWIQKLHSFGLLAASFRPEDNICQIRSLIRHRDTLIRQKATSIHHMQKSLEQMNIKLGNVISDIVGVSGLRIIRAILQGQRDFNTIAQLKDKRAKATKEEIIKSLQGDYRNEHLFTLQQALNQFDFYQAQIIECDQEIEKLLLAMDKKTATQQGQVTFAFYNNSNLKTKRKSSNDPAYDARNMFFDITGIDLIAVDGLGENTVQTILFEVGLDMEKWPTAKHFTAWLGLAPNPKISGGKNIGQQKRKVKNRAAQAFRMAAAALQNSKCALGAFFRRIKGRSGFKKAVAATARKLAVIFYNMLKNGTEYKQFSEEDYLKRFQEQMLKKLQRQAKIMGYQVVPQE